jgi:hypothetical protein
MDFIINNQKVFQTNSALHSVNTRNRHDLHRPAANISCLQKTVCNYDIKNFNSLPCSPKSIINKRAQFKAALKYLNKHPFYIVD